MAKHQFQTEVNQVLHLVINSLYSNKEIFLRELISNASDALDKLNYLTLTDDNFKNLTFEPKIDLTINKEEKSITISDTGIGMNEEDLVNHLGTIAKSGTKSFIEQLTGDAKKDSNLIGQFGVGFYSSFMVASKVEVSSKKAGEEKAYKWISEGSGEYEISECTKEQNGTSMKLFLKEGEEEFLEQHRIQNIVEKYSNHIPFGIYMEKENFVPAEKEGEEGKTELKIEQINKASALWTLSKSDIKEEEYKDFYKSISHDNDEPLTWFHTKAEGTLEYATLFYIPKKAPFDLFKIDYTPGVKLYINRVFITDDDKELMPTYLRFLRGVIDSSDLPLNVSREILQSNQVLAKIKNTSVKKVLSELAKMMKKDAAKYDTFYKEFGKVLKEGLYSDFANKEKILDLLKFKSLESGELITLAEYKEKMGEEQKEIYYILGENEEVLKHSPLLEKFKAKNYNVLILDEEVDTIVFPMVQEYKEVKLVNVTDASLGDEEELKKEEEKATQEKKELVEDLKNILGEQIKDVKVSVRLTDSPVVVVADKDDPSFAMAQMMKQMGNMELPEIKPILEINPQHELLKKFEESRDANLKEDIANLLLEQGKIFNGEKIADTVKFVERLNRVLTKAL